jgi:Putative metallopeptidase
MPAVAALGIRLLRPAWLVVSSVLAYGAGPVVAQPAQFPPANSQPAEAQSSESRPIESQPTESQPASPSRPPVPPEAAPQAAIEAFQARIDAAARALREDQPKLKNASPQYVQGLAEFVSGNMLFVLLHELAHVAITQMGLPVLGRMEDAADSFAALRLIDVGSEFSHRVLADAAEGWFMAHRRDEKMGEDLAFYAEHGLSRQRAYHIVCLMVGSDDEKFKDLADETKLPQARQDTCAGDYSNATFSWGLLLKPHRRAPDRARTKIEVVYGPATGRDAIARQVARSTRLLETVAEHAADEFAWPAPFTLKMQSCGFANARWNIPTRTLTVCYELVSEFADLYRDYGTTRADGTRLADTLKQRTDSVPAFKPNRRKAKPERKVGR